MKVVAELLIPAKSEFYLAFWYKFWACSQKEMIKANQLFSSEPAATENTVSKGFDGKDLLFV